MVFTTFIEESRPRHISSVFTDRRSLPRNCFHGKRSPQSNNEKTQEVSIASHAQSSEARISLECEYCGQFGHSAPKCYFDPENPNNKLLECLRPIYLAHKATDKSTKSTKPKTTVRIAGNSVLSTPTSTTPPMASRQSVDTSLTHSTVQSCIERTIVDSGASEHTFSNCNFSANVSAPTQSNDTLTATGRKSPVQGVGITSISFSDSILSLRDVLYVLDIVQFLISVGRPTDHGFRLIFVDDRCIFEQNSVVIGISFKESSTKLYHVPCDMIRIATSTAASISLQHQLAAHVGMNKLSAPPKFFDDIPHLKNDSDHYS